MKWVPEQPRVGKAKRARAIPVKEAPIMEPRKFGRPKKPLPIELEPVIFVIPPPVESTPSE